MTPPLSTVWKHAWILIGFMAPSLQAEDTEFILDLSKFDKPNSKAEGWTEAGIGTAELSYTHESGIKVVFRTANENSSVIVRTYIGGIGALGIDDPTIDGGEAMTIEITGMDGLAEISKVSLVGILEAERAQISAPGLVFFQQNNGKIAAGVDTSVKHIEEEGQTVFVGQTLDPSHVSTVEYFGADGRKGFSYAESHRIRVQSRGQKWNCAFAGIVFQAKPASPK